ncbi:MAG: hypothetical protein LH609_18160, partial [Rudanella sp.]|nr:hypothetical protein [Rudanella sp.]
QLELCQYSRKKRGIRLQLCRWKNLLFRSKNGHPMSDKPVDIVAIRTYDALTNEFVYEQPMFIGICGALTGQLSLGQIVEEYQGRYGIERQRPTAVLSLQQAESVVGGLSNALCRASGYFSVGLTNGCVVVV